MKRWEKRTSKNINGGKESLYIGDLDFWQIVSQKLVMNDYPEFIEKDLLSIYQTKEIQEDNIKNLFIYLQTLQHNRLPYYQLFVEFISSNYDAMGSAHLVDDKIDKDKHLFDVIVKHFYNDNKLSKEVA